MRQGSQDKGEEAAFWDRVARQRVYAAFDDDEYAAIFDRAMGGDLRGKRVIDIGSASGVSAARGATVLGIDISPELVTQANALWRDNGDRLSFAVDDAEHLDVPDASVDICFFGGVLHHLVGRDQKAFWFKRRVLRFVDAFRPPEHKGTFFVISGVKS